MKITPKRKQILETINNSAMPLSAGQIHELLGQKPNLATVYRTLNFLEANNLINGFSLFSSDKGTVRYYFRNQNPHLHFLFCRECHGFTPYHDCFFAENKKDIERKYKYKIQTHVLYFSGLCDNCA